MHFVLEESPETACGQPLSPQPPATSAPTLAAETATIIGDCIMETTRHKEEQHRTPEKCKSPTQVVKEWTPFSKEELKPKERLDIRKSTSKKTKEGTHKYKYYVCSKQGFRQASTNVNCNRKVKLTREDCNAMVGFRRTNNGRYVLFKFYESHTHLLATPRKRHMLNSNRGKLVRIPGLYASSQKRRAQAYSY
ncbi:hypothetical protein Cgig2_014891 [Carnegiea gigantea]|uniref:FAR1 domain-containing protein n=1 Tax=Carnegiea gigantea TaxID=171969 RepID=A0A9Q1JHQ2_9CARY|nr:hypothetical protein Cgig2_014891 [Carnegiea gigantea]